MPSTMAGPTASNRAARMVISTSRIVRSSFTFAASDYRIAYPPTPLSFARQRPARLHRRTLSGVPRKSTLKGDRLTKRAVAGLLRAFTRVLIEHGVVPSLHNVRVIARKGNRGTGAGARAGRLA